MTNNKDKTISYLSLTNLNSYSTMTAWQEATIFPFDDIIPKSCDVIKGKKLCIYCN